MGIDPLSAATRTAKRNLLLIAVAIITFKAFNVTVEQIPLASLSIRFDPGALGFLLSVGLTYFLLAFILYFYIDVKNFEVTKHQEAASKLTREAPYLYKVKLAAGVLNEIKASLPAGYALSLPDQASTFSKHVRANQIVGIPLKPFSYTVNHSVTTGRNMTMNTVDRSKEPELFSRVDDVFNRRTRLFWWRFRLNELRHRWAGRRVRFTYMFRNYFVDGILPVLVAIVALLALAGVINLDSLRQYSPVLKSPSVHSSD